MLVKEGNEIVAATCDYCSDAYVDLNPELGFFLKIKQLKEEHGWFITKADDGEFKHKCRDCFFEGKKELHNGHKTKTKKKKKSRDWKGTWKSV